MISSKNNLKVHFAGKSDALNFIQLLNESFMGKFHFMGKSKHFELIQLMNKYYS